MLQCGEISACFVPVSNKSFIIFAHGSSAAMVLIHWLTITVWSWLFRLSFTLNYWKMNYLQANQVQHKKINNFWITRISQTKEQNQVRPMARFLHFPFFDQSIKSKNPILDSQLNFKRTNATRIQLSFCWIVFFCCYVCDLFF